MAEGEKLTQEEWDRKPFFLIYILVLMKLNNLFLFRMR